MRGSRCQCWLNIAPTSRCSVVQQEAGQKVKTEAVPLGDKVADAVEKQAQVASAAALPVAEKAEEAVDELAQLAKQEAPDISDRTSKQVTEHAKVIQCVLQASKSVPGPARVAHHSIWALPTTLVQVP